MLFQEHQEFFQVRLQYEEDHCYQSKNEWWTQTSD